MTIEWLGLNYNELEKKKSAKAALQILLGIGSLKRAEVKGNSFGKALKKEFMESFEKAEKELVCYSDEEEDGEEEEDEEEGESSESSGKSRKSSKSGKSSKKGDSSNEEEENKKEVEELTAQMEKLNVEADKEAGDKKDAKGTEGGEPGAAEKDAKMEDDPKDPKEEA